MKAIFNTANTKFEITKLNQKKKIDLIVQVRYLKFLE